MKIAELFVQLGFKVEGKDDLLQFEKSMQNIAAAARNAALALKILARTQVPKVLMMRQPSAAPGATNPNVAVQPGAYNGPTPPMLPGPAQTLPTSVLQGLKSLGMLALKVGGIATVAMALKKLVSALTDMVRISMQATFAVDKFTSQTGLSRRELKEWERVAALSDMKAEQLQETFKALQQRSRQIRWTGEGATPFLQLGIDAMASPTEIAKQFAERTKQMDQATAVFWGNQIGLSEDFIYMLRKNADKLDSLLPGTELGEDEYKNITALNAAWKELTFNIGALKDKLVSELAPSIKWVVDQITNWVKLMAVSKPIRDFVLKGGIMNPFMALPLMRDLRSSNSTKVENNVEVNVNGADRPKETARETAAAVDRALSDAYYQQAPAGL